MQRQGALSRDGLSSDRTALRRGLEGISRVADALFNSTPRPARKAAESTAMRSTKYTSLRVVRVGSVFRATRAFCVSRGNYRNYTLRSQARCKRKATDGRDVYEFIPLIRRRVRDIVSGTRGNLRRE